MNVNCTNLSRLAAFNESWSYYSRIAVAVAEIRAESGVNVSLSTIAETEQSLTFRVPKTAIFIVGGIY
jgi:hypothetical protein